MRKIYIAHPLLGDMDRKNADRIVPIQNRHRAGEICRELVEKHPHVLILSPIHAFAFLDLLERERSLAFCRELLSLADELWVFGDWRTSEGCRKEIEWAKGMGKPVVFHA